MDDDQAHRDRLRKEYTKRLRLLEIRAARQGDGADPAVLSEIEELKVNIAGLDVIDQPKVAPKVREAIKSHYSNGIEDYILLIAAQIAKFGERVTQLEETHVWDSARLIKIEGTVQQLENNQILGQGRAKRAERRSLVFLVATFIVALLALGIAGWWLL